MVAKSGSKKRRFGLNVWEGTSEATRRDATRALTGCQFARKDSPLGIGDVW